jgi:hypothetical protein
MHGKSADTHLPRHVESAIRKQLAHFPAVALIGPRQCGKTTLAQRLLAEHDNAVYLDLERSSDRSKLSQPGLYFESIRSQASVDTQPLLICLDEIQRVPDLFSSLRSVIDEEGRPGQFLILGSASQELMRQTSETLAGRVVFQELTPLRADEVEGDPATLTRLWLRGGFPRSFLAADEELSVQWRDSFVRTFLERDLAQFGIGVPPEAMGRLWRMLAHHHGQTLNASRLGGSLGVSHTTVRHYLDLLVKTFMIEQLEPTESNLKKRLVKSPKIYLRDSGITHSLLGIETIGDLLGNPVAGASWEGLVIGNLRALMPRWSAGFVRTAQGAEVDLVLERSRRRIVVECKLSKAPKLSRGTWGVIEELAPEIALVVAPVDEPYPLTKDVRVMPLHAAMTFLHDLA